MSTQILFLHRLLTIAFVLGFATVNYHLSLQPTVERWFIDMGWTLAAGFSAIACFAAARYLKRPYRTAWTYYALGCASWFIGMLIWNFNELVLNWQIPFPSLADIGFLLLGPLFTIGLIYNFTKNPAVTLTLRNLADLGVIICSVLIFCLFVFSESIKAPGTTLLYKITALSFPVLNIAAFAFAILLVLRHGYMRQHYAVILIIISLGMHAVANLFYARSLLNYSYDVGHYLDIVWIIAFVFSYLAAIEIIRSKDNLYAAGPMFVSDRRTQLFETGMFTMGLLLLTVAAYYYHYYLNNEIWNIIIGIAIIMAILLGLREWTNYQVARKLNEDIHRSEKELSTILGSLQDTYFRTNKENVIKMISDSIETLLGYSPLELVGKPLVILFTDSEDLQRCLSTLGSNSSGLQNHEMLMKRKDGSNVWVSLNMQYIRDEARAITGIDGTIRDVSLRRQADAEMYKLSSALENTADSVVITNRNGIIEYINPAFEKTTGYTKTDALGRSPNIVKSGKQSETFYKRLWSTILGGEVFSEVFINKRKNGDLYYEAKTITPLLNEKGEITHFVSTGKDITEQMQTQEQLKFMAQHDILTELPNRALLLDRINQSLARARWHDRLVAILFLDLDRFKNINDSLGHNVGDQILIQLAERLHKQVRDRDTIARFGGDEFAILLDDIANENDVSSIAQKVLDSLKDVFVIDGMELHVSGSIGISIYPTDGEDSQTLLKNADSAMYRAKEAGKDTYKFYSTDMSVRAFERLTLENHLRYALQRNEFVLYYQPQVYIQTGRIVGFEALLRWQNPGLGLIAPGDFISLLEETGMIVNVGEWVLLQACRQLKQWNDAGYTTLTMAVNISARQFNDSSFKTSIKNALAQSGIRPEHLQLEMTESTFMRETNTTDYTFAALSKLGVSLAIDDFGTGYSALSYLKRFEIDTLKIDRTFVRDITTDENDAALTSAIVAMAKSLGMQVIAEGVETEEQLAFLKQQGCDHVQGFLLGKPQPASAIGELLAKNTPTH